MMKGFGRLRDRGLRCLQERRSCFGSFFLMAAAVAQVANAFHLAPEKCGTAVDLLRKCVTGRKLVPQFQQAGPGDEPIIRLPKLPTFLLPVRR